MKWKWVVGAVALLIVVLIVGAYVVLSGYDFNKLKPRIARAVRDATGRELVMGGDIDLRIGLTPVLTVEDVRFQNASWGSRPALAMLKRFEVQVALLPLLRGDIKVKRFVMIEPDILVETDKRGRSNLEFDPVPKASGAAPEEEGGEGAGLPQLSFERLLIKKGRFTYRDGLTSTSYVVKIERLAASAKDLKGSFEVALEGDYNGEGFEVNGTLGPLALFADPDKAWPLNLSAKAAGVVINIDGTVEDPLKLKGIRVDFRAEAELLDGLERLADAKLPFKGPLSISGSLSDIARKTYKVSKLKVAFGKSDLEGSIQARLAGKTPGFNAALKSRRLDLRPISKTKADGAGETRPKKKREKVFSDEPLNLKALKQVNGSVEIKIKKLLLPRLAVDDLDGRLILNKGHLSLKLLGASIGGGDVEGSLKLRPKGRSATVVAAFKANKIDLGRMLKDLEITDAFEGKLDVTVDLKGFGGSLAELMGSLDGNITLVMGPGQVSSKYLSLLGADLRQGVFRLINPMAREEDFTEINCFVSRFDLSDGLGQSTALVFDSTKMSVMGEGSVDLKTERLDFSLRPLPRKGTSAEGAGKFGLGELARPLKLRGTLANPSLAIDPLQAALAVGRISKGVEQFGALGVLAGLASSTGSNNNGGENLCLTAIETAKTGVRAPQVKQKKDEKTTDDITEGIKEIEKGLRMFFGK